MKPSLSNTSKPVPGWKNLLILIAFIYIGCMHTLAQVDHSFIDTNTEWRIETITWPSYTGLPILHTTGAAKFKNLSVGIDSNVRSGEVGHIVYLEDLNVKMVWLIVNGDTHLLYDYNYAVGDTIMYEVQGNVPCGPQPGFNHDTNAVMLVLMEIDSVLVGGENRMYYRFRKFGYFDSSLIYCQDRIWVDGIGDVNHPFTTEILSHDKYYYGVDCVLYKDSVLIFSDFIDANCIPLGLKEVMEGDIASAMTVFPNPGTDRFSIQCQEPVRSWSISGLDGRLLMAGGTEAAAFEINASHLPAGMYILSVLGQNRQWVKRLVKE